MRQVHSILDGVIATGAGDYFEVDSETIQKWGAIPVQIRGTYIGTASITGSGLDDITSGGNYTGSEAITYIVHCDSAGTTDTIKWSKDEGVSWEAEGVALTGAAQALDSGVTFTSAATTGHDLDDYWEIPCTMDFNGTVLLEATVATNQEAREGTALWNTAKTWTKGQLDSLTLAYTHIRGNVSALTRGVIDLKISV
jgi:hypothetical protein